MASMQLFCCWGHCVIGPNWRSGFGSALLILIPSAIYCWLVAPYLAGKVHVIILVIRWVAPWMLRFSDPASLHIVLSHAVHIMFIPMLGSMRRPQADFHPLVAAAASSQQHA